MDKNYQIVHRLDTSKQKNTYLYAAVSAANPDHQFTIKIVDLDKLSDNKYILVSKINKHLSILI